VSDAGGVPHHNIQGNSEYHHGRAVVKQAFALYDYCKPPRRAHLFEQRHHRNRVCCRDQGTEQKGRGKAHFNGDDRKTEIGKNCGQDDTQHQARESEENYGQEVATKVIDMHVKCGLIEQGRQKHGKQKLWR